MRSIWTPSSAPLCSFASGVDKAHPSTVGLLADQDILAVRDSVIGGPLAERPRNTRVEVRTQQRSTGLYGMGVPVAQGSGMTDVTAQAATKVSGVPPRGRPV